MSDRPGALLVFPNEFSLKAIGQDAGQSGSFARLVVELVHHHVPEDDRQAVRQRLSNGGKYTAVTVTFVARSQEQVETIYTALSGNSQVKMLL